MKGEKEGRKKTKGKAMFLFLLSYFFRFGLWLSYVRHKKMWGGTKSRCRKKMSFLENENCPL